MADSLIRLRVDSAEYNNKLKRASEELNRYADGCRKAGGTLEHVDEGVLEFTRSLGKMETVATSARGKLVEMTKAFTDMSLQYKTMTDEEKKGEYGKALSASLNDLKGRIQDTKVHLEDINRELNGQKFGQFGGMIDSVGQKFGITGSLTEMLTSKTALMTAGIGASIAVITKATDAWAEYNSELAKQDQQTAVITGLKGDDADRMTDTMRALVDTYKVDFRQAVEAANTLMSQFGESGDSAISIIKDGMQGMIQGDGPKLLQMIQQYAPAFRDAGVSARQLVAVIQNSEGGIFTDQNMNAIVMGIKNIRLMTKQTGEALAKMGIDGQKMSEQLSSGSLTVFDALKQVSSQLKDVDSNSQTAGEVMQTVFGRQGAMAGTNLAKAIEQLNTNLEETKKQTGEVGEAFADLQTANEKLNVAIREAFSYDGWDEMVTGIRSKLITVLAEVIDKLGQIRSYFSGENNVDWNITTKPGVQNLADDPNVDDHGNYIVKPWNNKSMKVVQPTQHVTPIEPPKPTKTTNTNKVFKTEEQNLNEALNKLTEEYIKASEERRGILRDEIKKIQDRQAEIKQLKDEAVGKYKPIGKMDQAQGVSFGGMTQSRDAEELQNVVIKLKTPLDTLQEQLKSLTQFRDSSLTGEQWRNRDRLVEAKQGEIDTYMGKGNEISGTDFKKFGDKLQGLSGGIASLTGGLKQMGIEIPQEVDNVIGVIQGLSTIIQGVQSVIQIFSTSSQASNTIALTANTAALWAVAATNAIPFAGGGIVHAADGYVVPGNSFSGDRVPALLNSGEVVLNRAQQNTLASELQGSGGGSDRYMPSFVSGEQIWIALNAYTKRTGRGELVTWR